MSATSYPASYRFEAPAATARLGTRWLAIAGVAGASAAIAGALLSTEQFFRGYLIGYMLVLGFSPWVRWRC